MEATKEQRLAEIAEHLDISPSDFRRAQNRFRAVKDWLAGGNYTSGWTPDTYLQGSFRLGTVVRPYRGDTDRDFDIDQVCELTMPNTYRAPGVLKNDIGDRLKENGDYERMLDKEGRRCWTLLYASEEERPGFHIDVLPALPSGHGEAHQIDITDKNQIGYSWSKSNPKGYYYWFKRQNTLATQLVEYQRQQIWEQNRWLYERPDDVPLQLVRTPLQRAIQLMKRHRDVFFAHQDSKPISIIITTIATHKYDDTSIFDTIVNFVKYAKGRHESILRKGATDYDGIFDYIAGKWSVPNPTHQGRLAQDVENFADKWNEDHVLPSEFFAWVYQLDRDIWRYEKSGVSNDLNLRVKAFGSGSIFGTLQMREAQDAVDHGINGTNELLKLIHLGIEGKLDWEPIKAIAQSIHDNATHGESKAVAAVNLYQIARHRRWTLSTDARHHIRAIMRDHPDDAGFKMCGNILLGTHTRDMIGDCIRQGKYSSVLTWPIMRLVDGEQMFARL